MATNHRQNRHHAAEAVQAGVRRRVKAKIVAPDPAPPALTSTSHAHGHRTTGSLDSAAVEARPLQSAPAAGHQYHDECVPSRAATPTGGSRARLSYPFNELKVYVLVDTVSGEAYSESGQRLGVYRPGTESARQPGKRTMGSVQCDLSADGWRSFLRAAYLTTVEPHEQQQRNQADARGTDPGSAGSSSNTAAAAIRDPKAALRKVAPVS